LDLESAKENVIQAMSQLALAKQKAEKTIIKSPINGTVIATRIKEGETAISSTLGAAGSELMLIADLSDYSIMAYISEFDISRISVGQSAIVKLNNNPQQLLTGKIVHVATMLNASYKNEGRSKNDRQIAVEISFKAHDNEQLYAGMGAELEILESQSSPITVPLSAVLYDEKTDKERTYIAGSKRNYFLYTIEDNIVVKKMVELGVSDRSLQEIRKGIQVGERVIYGPAKFLNSLVEGDTVTDHSTNNQRVVNKSAINE
jgi:HlyD family secretion protein